MFKRESSAWKPNGECILFWENKFIFKSQEVSKSNFHTHKKIIKSFGLSTAKFQK